MSLIVTDVEQRDIEEARAFSAQLEGPYSDAALVNSFASQGLTR